MKKKLPVLILLLLLALPLALAGCDKNDYVWSQGAGTFVDLSAMPEGTAEQYQYLYDQSVVADESDTGKDYLAHPDSVLLDNGDILTALSLGHGKGGTVMRISRDKGLTWEAVALPDSFSTTEETPTVYKLGFTDGTQRLVLIAGRPSWADVPGSQGEGWDAAVSSPLNEDGSYDGVTWTELENYFGPNTDDPDYNRPATEWDCVVAMSSLTQLKDENGNFIDKWMGTFHDDRYFINYKTYLTFDENGDMVWTEPVRLLGQNKEYSDVEQDSQFCEVEIIRSPDGGELAALFRANAHRSFSYVSFSTDEGETWSEPQTLSPELTGDRHKAEYDPATGKLVITLRSIVFRNNDPSEGWNSQYSRSYGWVMWIGDYEDLKHGADATGDLFVKLAHTYGGNDTIGDADRANADTGYAGLVIYDDGLIVTTSYGTFSPADDPERGGDTYIIAKRLTISDVASLAGVSLR